MTLSRTPPHPQKKKNPVQTIRPNRMSRPEKTRSSISCIEIRTIIPRNLCPRVSLPFNHSLESDDTFYYKKPRRFPFLLRSNTPEKKKNGAKCSLFAGECSSTSRPHSLPPAPPPPFSLNRRPPRLPRRPQKKHTFLRGSAIRKAPAGSTRQVAQKLRLTRRSHRRSTLLNSTTL